ncbi:germinal-center associated nuclear protein [Polymixia lowei]
MNPNNLFGSSQGGAFQAPSNTNKTGLFQSFGQQTTSGHSQPQTMGFFQSAAFGQPSILNQPPAVGNTMFGQTPAFGQASVFGQSSVQSSTQPTMSQAPAFGQPNLGQSNSGFTGSTPPSFGQPSGSSQSSLFGQASTFGQPSAFGQPSGFGQPTLGFGHSTGISQTAPGSTASLGSSQPMNFAQSPFGQPLSTSVTSSTFATAQSVTQSRGFGKSEFNFKPSNEAVFKPIFSASPEPANPQVTSGSDQPFNSGASQTSSSTMESSGSGTTTGFSLLTGAKSGPLDFNFSQPTVGPSISARKDPLTTGSSSDPTSTLQFTFSQPAAPSSTSTNPATTQPTTPSSFSFSAKVLQPQKVPLFGGANFGQTSAFGDPKAKVEAKTEERGTDQGSTGEANIFARLGKGIKRKEDPPALIASPEKPIKEEEVSIGGDVPRHPPKRPLVRPHGPAGGLFGRAVSGLKKTACYPVRREAAKENRQQASEWGEAERADSQAQGGHQATTPPRAQAPTREVLEKAEESDSARVPDPEPETTTPSPSRRSLRRESSESLTGMSPADGTVIQCKNVPPNLNKKDVIEKHFGRFGKVRRVFCRPNKNQAIVHFQDHASAAKAKKKGKSLHRHELLLFWQRKKPSPGEKGRRPSGGEEVAEEESQATESKASPRPALRGPAVSSMVTFSRSSPVKKPSIAKSLQFDNEPQQESSPETLSSERPVPSSLLHLIGQGAETAEDKYRLLEQRDKILRQGRRKQTDLNLSKVFVGTCPDMCPEKERYMRETRNQLSAFEVFPDTEMVDHAAAIKEYSRSSADQEEPLPHELRPLPVLSMTMDYLVTQVMDQGHDNYRDWYDFVWNRTRGIRKDITQQHLCCPETVSLIEKCTRFHVHCAHHLCEEPMMTFDAKINNENMTKCMQSLKEMYQDLATRQIYCPREAEFRQYNVLLKLNDGDILREVQQFREEVRNSPEVKFAVQAFAAVNSNNFVRFFRLVKNASYLASCLLHRYFNQVRGKALRTLNIAHTVGSQRSTTFPIEDMVRMLMFLSTSEAIDFIQQYGLNVSDGLVELSRTTYQEPELSLSQKRSEAILGKRAALIGEVVHGGPLPNPPHHTPVCSFDSQNKYRGEGLPGEPTPSQSRATSAAGTSQGVKAQSEVESRLQMKPAKLLAEPRLFGEPQTSPDPAKPAATDETGEPSEASSGPTLPAGPQQLFQPIFQPQPIKPPTPPPPKPVYSDEDILAELESVVEEVIEATVSDIANAGASYASAALVESYGQVEALVGEVVGKMIQEMSSAEVQLEQERITEEKRKLEEARRRQEHEAFLTQFSFSLCTEIIQEVLDESTQETAASEIQEAVREKAERVASCTEQVCTSLVEETLDGEIALLVEDILEAELQCIHKYIKRWRDVVSVRRQLKRQMRGFPAAPCCVDPRFKLKALAPSAPSRPSMADLARGLVNLGNGGTVALSSTRLLKMRREAIHQMRVHYYYQRLLDETAWAPLDLPALVTENILNAPDRIFWKAALLLPSDHESVASLADRVLSDWLEVKLSGGEGSEVREKQPDGTLQTLCVVNALHEKQQRAHKVHISIKVSRGPLTDDGLSKVEECCDLQGTGALLLLLPALPAPEPGQEEQDVPLLSALLQLKQLQQASPWHCPLPLVILVPGPDGSSGDTQKLEEALMLQTLVEERLISEYMFFHIPETTSDLQGSEQLNHAMRWLLARAPPPYPLCCQTLVQFVEAGLSREFSARLSAHRQERVSAGLPSQDPAPVIHLYNAVLAHLAHAVSSQDLSGLSWPPGEFCLPETRDLVPLLGWNSSQHLAWLRDAILSLQIPDWELPSTTAPWSQLCSSICRYGSEIPASHHSRPLLMSRLENLLERVRLRSQRGPARGAATALGYWTDWDQTEGPGFHQVPWDDVLVLCIDHKLKDWQSPEPPVCEDAVMEDGEILVYFSTESLKGFQPPEEWTQAVRRTHREKQQENQGASGGCCGPPTGLSIRQRLFQSLAEPREAPAASLDFTHTPSPQELLPLRILQDLEEEKAHSQRSMEQLQRWLDADPLDHVSIPLFMPSSTLLSSPSSMVPTHTAKTPGSSLTQEAKPDEPAVKAAWPRSTPVSMTRRMKEIERQILASQEEELACRLKLSGLLSIVDD